MMNYDPLIEPDSELWLQLGVSERIDLVLDFHRKAGIELPNEHSHATIHATVETQAALGDETPVAQTLVRLAAKGLDRHDAVHAVGSVLASYIYDLLKGGEPATIDPNIAYFAEVRALTARKWFDEFSD